jgi:hypothetical protein
MVRTCRWILDEAVKFLELGGVLWLQPYFRTGAGLLQDHRDHVGGGDESGSVRTKQRAVLILSHDRSFVNNICGETVVLRDGTLRSFREPQSASEADLRTRIAYMREVKEANERQVRRGKERSIGEEIGRGEGRGGNDK